MQPLSLTSVYTSGASTRRSPKESASFFASSVNAPANTALRSSFARTSGESSSAVTFSKRNRTSARPFSKSTASFFAR